MDDEKIYCSELIFKGYRDATGEQLGKLVKFGDLKWVAHPVILAIEEATANRIMITPRHLSEAKQLEKVFSSKEKIREALGSGMDFPDLACDQGQAFSTTSSS